MRRRRLIGVYRGLRKSMSCRDSVNDARSAAAAGLGSATQCGYWNRPDRTGNLADRGWEHNRGSAVVQTSNSCDERVPMLVDLRISSRYARPAVPPIVDDLR